MDSSPLKSRRNAPVVSVGFRADVIAGLLAQPRSLPSKYLYDEAGSRLFEQITQLPEYYLTRVELGLLEAYAAEIGALVGPGAALVEFGSGSTTKMRRLLAGLERPSAYVGIDVSGDFLRQQLDALARERPDLAVHAVVGDFAQPLALPDLAPGGRRLGFFPGSTIGNMPPPASVALLARFRATLGPGALMVVGHDTRKDPAVISAAYNDSQGVTAAFSLNLLARINRELGASFDLDRFVYRGIWNEAEGRMELYLDSLIDQVVRLDRHAFVFRAGESILTEVSHKYHPAGFVDLARRAGWQPQRCWTDAKGMFAVHCLGS